MARKVVKVYVPLPLIDVMETLSTRLGLTDSEVLLDAFIAYAEKYGLITDTIRGSITTR
jgi:hypothetical protein